MNREYNRHSFNEEWILSRDGTALTCAPYMTIVGVVLMSVAIYY
jgi:hypothetical protein